MSRPSISTMTAALAALLSAEQVSATGADRQHHAQDQSAFAPSLPDVVVWPRNSAEVSRILAYANERGIPVTPWGAGTGIEGNAIPLHGGIVLSLRDMDSIVAVHESDFQITVEPGVLYKDMNHQLARHGLFFAPDPGANASIGGMLANNAAGSRTVKYGATRDNVLALEVVLADGAVITTGSRSVKQSSGYDLTHLFVGSEGTLGIITAATLRLHPLPDQFSAATVAFPSVSAAAAAVFDIIGSGLEPAALELLDAVGIEIINAETDLDLHPGPNLFLEFSGASETTLAELLPLVRDICDAHGCTDYRAGVGRDERARLWEARHRVFEAHLRHFPGQSYVVTDVAVPISRYPELIEAGQTIMANLALAGSIISHAGDGNAHFTVFYEEDDTDAQNRAHALSDRLVQLALRLDGTATGEHGVGIGKQKFMAQEHGAGALHVMRRIKQLFDPNGILNPGKVLAQD